MEPFSYAAVLWFLAKMVITIAISYGIAELLAKDPPRAAAALPKVATVEQGRSFPVPFGTPKRITGVMLFWYGDTRLYERERHDVLAYINYYWAAHVGVCAGAVEGLDQFWYGEKVAWPTPDDPTVHNAAGETLAHVDAGGLYGSPYSGGTGGCSGYIDIEYGGAAQTRNAYLQYYLGDGPAFRGFLGLVFRQYDPDDPTPQSGKFFWGNSPYPQTIGVIVHRQGVYSTGGEAIWYAAKAAIGRDMNPAHMIYEGLTDTTWGDARLAERLGASFTTGADTLYTESLGLSAWYVPGAGSLADFIDQVLGTIDGYLYEDHATGLIEMGLCRGDYVAAQLPRFDASDFEIIAYNQVLWGDMCGRVIVKFSNRYYPEATPSAVYEDGCIIAKQGGRANESVETLDMIYEPAVANAVVARRGVAATYRLSLMTLRCKRTMADLHVGSPFRIAYADTDLSITQMIVRVLSIEDDLFSTGYITLEVAEDVWGAAYTIYGNPPATEMSTPAVVFSTSATPSVSPSASVSASPSTSISASKSSSPSASKIASPSVSASASPSSSPSTSKSNSPSASPSSSASASPSSSASV